MSSMEPNFYTSQRVIVSRVNYMIENPERGEIIVFESPKAPGVEPPLIKRVIGLPGETIQIGDSQVFINGQPLDEPYINEASWRSTCLRDEWKEGRTLGPEEYFVMGDNRNHSNDSRCFGAIKREHIIGEALIRYWPPENWNLLYKFRFPDNPFQ